ncbi:uncharacterized protein [Coffea arabica]|uniref:Uncharacterized protein n=1 Tax=Coffea arabica TaxID=13443 RepID=A0A6P6WY50_COFAR|nr:uncharacterized protein LOC113737368 [Coffea arabica]
MGECTAISYAVPAWIREVIESYKEDEWAQKTLSLVLLTPTQVSDYSYQDGILRYKKRLAHPFDTPKVARLFIDHVSKLHGIPQSMLSDRDRIFVSQFWGELFSMLGVKLDYSTAYHPQTDGQTERAQERMKKYADEKRSEREFNKGDWVYLRLQPYRHSSVALRGNTKLSVKYFGPYKIEERIGNVAYRLNLPTSSKIHPVFHVSLPKKKVGDKITPILQLSETNEKGHWRVEPVAVLDRRMVKKRNAAAIQWLIHWWGTDPAEATWEDAEEIGKQFPTFQS